MGFSVTPSRPSLLSKVSVMKRIAILLVLAFALTGCGGSSSGELDAVDDGNDAAGQEATTSTPTTTTTAAPPPTTTLTLSTAQVAEDPLLTVTSLPTSVDAGTTLTVSGQADFPNGLRQMLLRTSYPSPPIDCRAPGQIDFDTRTSEFEFDLASQSFEISCLIPEGTYGGYYNFEIFTVDSPGTRRTYGDFGLTINGERSPPEIDYFEFTESTVPGGFFQITGFGYNPRRGEIQVGMTFDDLDLGIFDCVSSAMAGQSQFDLNCTIPEHTIPGSYGFEFFAHDSLGNRLEEQYTLEVTPPECIVAPPPETEHQIEYQQTYVQALVAPREPAIFCFNLDEGLHNFVVELWDEDQEGFGDTKWFNDSHLIEISDSWGGPSGGWPSRPVMSFSGEDGYRPPSEVAEPMFSGQFYVCFDSPWPAGTIRFSITNPFSTPTVINASTSNGGGFCNRHAYEDDCVDACDW